MNPTKTKMTSHIAFEYPRVTRTMETTPLSSLAQIVEGALFKRLMRILSLVSICFVMLTFVQTVRAQTTNRYSVVARKVVDLLNAGDYAAVQKLFTAQMSTALPPQKASEFFSGLSTQFGRMEKFDGPIGNGAEGWLGFQLRCERGELIMNLALDAGGKIAGINFRPAPKPSAQAVRVDDTKRYSIVAQKLIDLLNAGDYVAVQKLFNPEMSKALPVKQASEFFTTISTQYGNIEKLDGPTSGGSEGRLFRLRCQRGQLMMTLTLDTDDKIAGLYFPPPPESSGNEPKRNQTQLALPFKGRWLVFWGGDTRELNQHHDAPAQRGAFDLVSVDDSGRRHRGDGTKNEDYFCFGREIYAPAEGVVVEAIDGVRDNTPGSMNPYSLVGNCVVIQHRTNEFSVLAHFQRGSVAVKAGDRVQRGQLVGKCGNSGNSSEPHLHYHLQNSAIFQDALGIKCVFEKVPLVRDGTTKSNYSPIKGDVINAE